MYTQRRLPSSFLWQIPIVRTCGLCLLAAAAAGGGRAELPRNVMVPSDARVRSVLEDEANGKVTDRASALAEVRATSPNLAEANWHSGWIRWRQNWMPYEAIADNATYRDSMDAYQKERAKLELNPGGEQELAVWCRRHDRVDQERVHWLRVLEAEPDHRDARARLGYRLIEGCWYLPEEVQLAREQTQDVRRRLLKWMPTLKSVIADCRARDPNRRSAGFGKLAKIGDPDAIPALEVAALQADNDLAPRFVQLIAETETLEAATALARIAVSDAYGSAGDAAARALRKVPTDYYAPALLRMLSSPISRQFTLMEGSNGTLALQQLLFRETEDRREVQRLENTIAIDQTTHHVDLLLWFSLARSSRGVKVRNERVTRSVGTAEGNPIVAQAARTYLEQEARDYEANVAAANARIEDLNERICGVLSVATGCQLPADPNAWWRWWYDQNELYVPDQKPTRYSYQSGNYVIPQTKTQMFVEVQQFSCLVAGVRIQTADGLCPIEAIQPGDLVLAQRVESGELAYRPVLRVTTRPPAAIVRIETERDTIRATGGHLFWVAGRGWIRSRQLEPGMRLHTAQGTVEIQTVAAEPDKEPAYNLIVPDFHTYFVGTDRVLSYDNTPLQPTTCKVPGLTLAGS